MYWRISFDVEWCPARVWTVRKGRSAVYVSLGKLAFEVWWIYR